MHSSTIVSHRVLLFLSLFTLACYGSKSVDSGTYEEGLSDGTTDGSDSTADGSDGDAGPTAMGCVFADIICVEHFEGADWCSAVGGQDAAACPGGATNTCSGISGGDYVVGGATAYYYNGFDGAAACADAGGTYN